MEKIIGNNNIVGNISNSGNNNNFQIGQFYPQPSAKLTLDKTTVRIINKKDLTKTAGGSFGISIGAVALTAIATASDCFGLASAIGFQPVWLLAIGMPIAMAPLLKNHRKIQYILRRPRSVNEARFTGEGEIIQNHDRDNFLIGKMTGRCIYEPCRGIIQLASVPPKEKQNVEMDFVGVCSVGGINHSYFITRSWDAYPARFDWSKLNKD